VTADLAGVRRATVEGILAAAWGGPVTLASVVGLAERDHVVRVETGDGRGAVVKLPRPPADYPWPIDPEGVALEWASLEHLDAVAQGVAPGLLGGDGEHGLVVMEALPDVRSLDESLLGRDPAQAREDVLAWSRILARLHAETRGTAAGFAAARARRGLPAHREPWWLERLAGAAPGFTAEARDHDVDPEAVAADLDRIRTILSTNHVALVHGDPCPDNVLITSAGSRLIDYERASMASAALDFAYLLSPFPSCWCFGLLPADLVAAAVAAYEDAVAAAGTVLGDAWGEAVTAALALFAVVRVGDRRGHPRDDGDRWGTTTFRPRLAAWTASLLATPGAEGFPHVVAAVAAWRDHHGLDGSVEVPGYPALG
jgi:Ser/Thr protein kinase RdoA (MazF antagonist)